MLSTTITVRLLDKPEHIYTPRSYNASIKKEAKTYWLVNIDGFHSPWKFSKSDNRRIDKPKHDQANYCLEINTVKNTGGIDNVIKEVKDNHLLKSGDMQLDSARHELYKAKLSGCLVGVMSCFGIEHRQYLRLWDVYKEIHEEWVNYYDSELKK